MEEKGGCIDVRLEGQRDDGLANGGEHKGPRPPGVGDVHPGRASHRRGQGGGKAFAVVVAPRAGVEGGLLLLERGLVGRVCVGREGAIEGLTSQEGCSGLVGRNFGRGQPREAAEAGDIEGGGGERVRSRGGQQATCACRCVGKRRAGGTAETGEAAGQLGTMLVSGGSLQLDKSLGTGVCTWA